MTDVILTRIVHLDDYAKNKLLMSALDKMHIQ